MDPLTDSYRRGLSAAIEALGSAWKAFRDRAPDAIDSIRRVARSLRGSSVAPALPEIADLASILENARETEVPACLERLLAVLHEVTSSNVRDKAAILIIDDDRLTIRTLEEKLAGADREIYIAPNAAVAERILEEKDITLIILDIVLPDMDGRNFLIRLRERSRTAGIPVIVVSGLQGVQPKSECFALGADDYFEKPVNPDVLTSVVAARLKRAAEFTRELRRDVLTGLLNRVALREAFERAMSLAQRTKDPITLSVIDLDNFKSINDTYGHLAGDQVLRRVAILVSKVLRKSDLLARWGGDELVSLFQKTDHQGAARALERALQLLRQEQFQTPDGRTFQLTFSAGIAEVAQGATLANAIAAADRFLYLAKTTGRNRVLTPADGVTGPIRKILLADDNKVVASIVRRILKEEGFEVLHHTDGAAALSAAPQAGASLIILDVLMPGLDGFEVLKRLRQQPAFNGTPIVMLTSMGSKEDIAKAMEFGANDYILKPFTPAELLGRVRRLLVSFKEAAPQAP